MWSTVFAIKASVRLYEKRRVPRRPSIRQQFVQGDRKVADALAGCVANGVRDGGGRIWAIYRRTRKIGKLLPSRHWAKVIYPTWSGFAAAGSPFRRKR